MAGKGMCWLTYIPDGKKRSVTAMFTEDGHVSAWYVDVIESVVVDDDGMLAFMDQYLDVMLTTAGDVITDDKDELDAAYQAGEFTREQYEEAITERERIISDLGTDIHATEANCMELLKFAREESRKQPLTVFVDVDGVLDIYDPLAKVQELLPEAMKNLSDLVHRMNAKVVIISSHRMGGDNWDMLINTLQQYGITDVLTTPWGKDYHSRTEEMNAYLKMHPEQKRFAILDDCYQDDYRSDSNLRNHLVFVDALKGLQKEDLIKTSAVLNSGQWIYEMLTEGSTQ